MAGLFGGGAEGLVVVVEHDAEFVHESDLFGIVAAEVVVRGGSGGGTGLCGGCEGGRDVGKQAEDVLGGDGGGLGHCYGGHIKVMKAAMSLEVLAEAEDGITV